MDNLNQIEQALEHIKATYGSDTIFSPEKTKALLFDLAPQSQKEVRILLNVINQTEIIKAIHTNQDAPIDLIINRIIDSVGMSYEWAKDAAILLFNYFGREYTLETVAPSSDDKTSATPVSTYDESKYIDNPTHSDPSILPYLKRAKMFLQDGDFSNAHAYCEKVLDADPYCAIAYFYELMAEKKAATVKDLTSCVGISTDRLFEKALSFASEELKEELTVISNEAEKNYIARCDKVRSAALLQSTIISASAYHITGVCSDGTVWAEGDNNNNECNVSHWKDIVAVSAGARFTAGVKADGRVVLTEGASYQDYDTYPAWTTYYFDLSAWRDIVAVSANTHIVGLRSDGTVIAQGLNRHGECNVSGWTNIVAIATDYERTVGLKADGTVVATGDNRHGECNTYNWSDIVAISTAMDCVLGLKKDGTVVCTKGAENQFGQCDVSTWTDIVAISSNSWTTFGVKSDGTAISTRHNFFGEANVYNWKDVVALAPMGQQQVFTTFCVKKDGSIESVGSSFYGLPNVLGKRLFHSFDTWESEFKKYKLSAEKSAAEEYRINKQKEQYRAQNLCQHCGGSFKGLFTKKCANCGREKDY